MKIYFSFNQASLLQTATVRVTLADDVLRSYFGIPESVRWSRDDMLKDIKNSGSIIVHESSEHAHFSVRGIEFDLVDLTICCDALNEFEKIQVKLDLFSKGIISLSTVSRQVRKVKDLLERVEW